MTWLIGIIKIIIALGTLVTIHELGHFLVAKACKIKVHKFAIGFGPKIFKKQKGETEYTLRLIPFGGFVQLEGEEQRSEDERAFNNKPVWQRMLVIVAGATVNIIFALIIYYGICMSSNLYVTSTLENVETESEAYQYGFREGDKILSINGKKAITQNHVKDAISRSKSDDMTFEVERKGNIIKIDATIPEKQIGVIGVGFDENTTIAYVQGNSVAASEGISIGDKIISINGQEGLSVSEYVNIIKASPNTEIDVVVERNGQVLNYTLIPDKNEVRIFDVGYEILSKLNFWENSYYAIDEAGYYFNETVRAFATLITGKAENADVMGPVGIAEQITQTQKWTEFFYLMSAISLSLGIFNLLPLPALDGGKFLFLLIEGVRGKPMKEKTEMSWQLIGLTFIIGLAIFVTIKDVVSLF